MDWVEIEAVDVMVTIKPERLIFSAGVVTRRLPSADAKAVDLVRRTIHHIEAIERAFVTIVVIWPSKALKFAFNA